MEALFYGLEKRREISREDQLKDYTSKYGVNVNNLVSWILDTRTAIRIYDRWKSRKSKYLVQTRWM
jgi:hypothetical protein